VAERKPDDEDVLFSAVIRAEKEAALAAFRASDFESKVRKRWLECGKSPARRPAPRLTLVMVAAGALLLVVAGVLFLGRPRPAARPGQGISSLASVLSTLPGSAALGGGTPASGTEAARYDASVLARSVGAALAVPEAGQDDRETIPSVREKAGTGRGLSLYRKMEILFKDRVIERALLALNKPDKEV
jgi:hypothetical protein